MALTVKEGTMSLSPTTKLIQPLDLPVVGLLSSFWTFILFKKIIYFLMEGYLLYRILLFSVKPQHASAIEIHIFPPS